MFKTDEVVLYGTNGVCKITDITNKRVGKEKIQYYVLKPMGSQTSTLFVPTQNENLVGKMRYVMTQQQINEILESIPKDSESSKWIENKNERFIAYKNIISAGECEELVSLIRTIHIHADRQTRVGKKLHISDERFLKEAEKMVCDEFSLVLNIDQNEVLSMILE